MGEFLVDIETFLLHEGRGGQNLFPDVVLHLFFGSSFSGIEFEVEGIQQFHPVFRPVILVDAGPHHQIGGEFGGIEAHKPEHDPIRGVVMVFSGF